MLSAKPIKNVVAADHYFFGVDNYYLDNSTDFENTTAWWGAGAKILNLAGPVDRKVFSELLDGKLPTGKILGRYQNGERQHHPGHDLTFSAPKSVSILAEVCKDKDIYTAHEKAVNDTLEMIQKECAQARMSKNGNSIFIDTNNLTVAKIRHDLSREQDAQLHTHCIVMNATLRPDSKWRSLARQDYKKIIAKGADGFLERVYENKIYYGIIYRANLAYQLKQQGYQIQRTHKDNRFEIIGVPFELIKLHSKRREQIEAVMAKKGLEGARAAATVALATRVTKEAVDRKVLHEFWKNEAASMGFSLDEIVKNVKTQNPDNQKILRTPEEAVTFGIKHLSEREACFGKNELITEALTHILGDAPPSVIFETIDAFAKAGKLIEVLVGNDPKTTKKVGHWTTPEAVALEKATVQLMKDGQNTVSPIFEEAKVQSFLDSERVQNLLGGKHLSKGQREAIAMILTTKDRVVGVQGDPGVGKTTMFKVVKLAVEETGYKVLGLAAGANAVRKLHHETGIKSITLSAYLVAAERADRLEQKQQQKNPDQYPEKVLGDSKTIIIVDESSTVSTTQMYDLLSATAKRNIRTVPAGDTKQIDSVLAGRPFYQLQKYGMQTSEVKEIIRQKDQELRAAVDYTIKKQFPLAIEKLGNRLYEVEYKDERIEALVDLFLSYSQQERMHTKVGTGSRKDREKVNLLIRSGLRSEGIVKGEELTTNVLFPADLTTVEKCTADYYTTDSVVRFNKNYSSLGVSKGEYLKVSASDKRKNIVTLESADGRSIQWNPNQVGGRRKGAIEVFLAKEQKLAVGDVIRWTRNNYAEDIYNGSTATVTKIKNNKVTLAKLGQQLADNGNRTNSNNALTLDVSKLQNQHWDYNYTLTIHGLQGDTCNRILINQDSYNTNLTTQKSFLVAISRARLEAHVFTDDKKLYIETLQKYTGNKTTALESLQSKEEFESYQTQRASEVNDKKQHELVLSKETISKLEKPHPKLWDAAAIERMLVDQAETIVTKLLGDPKKRDGSAWRYGKNKGSLIVTMQGEKRGLWHDFQADKGGNLINLIQDQQNLSFKQALDYAAHFLGLSPEMSANLKINAGDKQVIKNEPKSLAKPPLTEQQLKMQRYARQLEAQSLSAKGSIVERYLREHRKITTDLPDGIRFHPRVWDSNSKKAYPAMVVIAKDEKDITQSVQATYLDPLTANKAQIEQQKRTYGSVRGAAVKINNSFNTDLNKQSKKPLVALAEGIETALSVAAARPDLEVYATLGVSNFANFPLGEGDNRIRQLLICADNDGETSDSQKLVDRIANKLLDKKVDVIVAKPQKAGQDFNDVLKNEGIEAARKLIDTAEHKAMRSIGDIGASGISSTDISGNFNHDRIKTLGKIYDVVSDAREKEAKNSAQMMGHVIKNVLGKTHNTELNRTEITKEIGRGLNKTLENSNSSLTKSNISNTTYAVSNASKRDLEQQQKMRIRNLELER